MGSETGGTRPGSLSEPGSEASRQQAEASRARRGASRMATQAVVRAWALAVAVACLMRGAVVVVAGEVHVDGVDFETFHSHEWRTAQHAEALRRNLQTADMAKFNDMLKNLVVGLVGTLELPPLLGATPIVRDVNCNGMSMGALTSKQSAQGMGFTMSQATLSCTATVGLKKKDGSANTINLAFGTAGAGMSLMLGTDIVAAANGDQVMQIAGGAQGCSLSLTPSLQILKDPNAGFFAGLLTGAVNTLVGALAPAMSGLIGGIGCSLVRSNLGAATANVVPATTRQTIATSAFLRNISDVATESKPTWFNFSAFERAAIRASPQFKAPAAAAAPGDAAGLLDFRAVPALVAGSAFLAQLLGVKGTGKNADRLVVNEAAEKLAVAFGDASGANIKLDGLLKALPPLALELAGLKANINLKSATLRGANTLQAFDLMRPNLEAATVLNNKLALGKAGIDIALGLDLVPPAGDILIPLPGGAPVATASVQALDMWVMKDAAGQPYYDLAAVPAGGDIPMRWRNEGLAAVAAAGGPQIKVAGLQPLQDQLSITLDMSNLRLDMALLLAINTAQMGEIPLGGLTSDNFLNTLQCLSTGLYAVNVPTLGMGLKLPTTGFLQLSSQTLAGPMSFAATAANTLAGLLAANQDVGPVVSGLMQGALNNLLSKLTNKPAGLSVETLCNPKPGQNPSFVDSGKRLSGDVKDSLPIPLDPLLNQFLGVDGDLGLNRMLRIVTGKEALAVADARAVERNADGSVTISGKVSEIGLTNAATFTVTIKAALEGVDTLNPNATVLVKSTAPFVVNNAMLFAGPVVMRAQVQSEISGELFTDNKGQKNAFSVVVDLGAMGFDSVSSLKLDLGKNKNRKLRDLGSGLCPLNVVSAFAITGLDVARFMTGFNVQMQCDGPNLCSTRLISDLGRVLQQPATRQAANAFVINKLAPFVEKVMTDPLTWSQFNQTVLGGPLGNCDLALQTQAAITGNALSTVILGGVGAFLLLTLLACAGYLRVLHRRGLAAQDQQQGGRANNWRQSMALVMRRELSLVGHGATPLAVKLGTAALGVAALALFGSGLLGAANTSVALVVSYADGRTAQLTPSPQQTGVTLDPNALVNILVQGNAFLLAGSVGVLSGVLPFVWVLSVVFCVLVPTTILSVPRRGKVLLSFSSIGKWTLMFPFLLVIITVGVRFNMGATDAATGQQVVALDVFVTASSGLIQYCLGVVAAFALNRLALRAHRTAAEADAAGSGLKAAQAPDHDLALAREAVMNHAFRCERGSYQISAAGRSAVVMLVALSIVGLFAGLALPAFRFTVGGVAGAFATIDNRQTGLGIAAALQSTVEAQSDGVGKVLGTALTVGSLLVLLVIAPLAQAALLGCLWAVPATVQRQRTLFRLGELAQSLEAVEVFLLTIAVAALQLNTTLLDAIVAVSPLAFMCAKDPQGDVPLARAARQSSLSPAASSCVELTVAPQAGFVVLLVAVILGLVAFHSIMRCADKTVQDRALQSSGVTVNTEALFDETSIISRVAAAISGALGCLVAAQPGQGYSGVVPHAHNLENGAKGGRNLQQQQPQSMSGIYSSSQPPLQQQQTWNGVRSNGSGGAAANPRYGAPAASASAADPSLPKGWTVRVDPRTGQPFYQNQQNGVTSWSRPL